MVVTRLEGRTMLTVRGPETRATEIDCPAEGEWIGLRFKLGTFMAQFPVGDLMDRNDVNLPEATGRSFWLGGSAWEYPDFENAECFVKRLVNRGLIVRDPAVEAVLKGDRRGLSQRSVQRHFLAATGMSYGAFNQIERARYATRLLRQGMSILDTVYEAGYFDQAHLTRSLGRLIGITPAKIRLNDEQLSFLYKTSLSESGYDADSERI
jgi:AraC-like DNA-binding protein